MTNVESSSSSDEQRHRVSFSNNARNSGVKQSSLRSSYKESALEKVTAESLR